MQSAFKNTPYAQDPNGTEDLVASFTQAEVAAYYRQLLNKNRMFLVVVGKLSKEELRQKIHESFAGLPSKPYEPVAPTVPDFTKNSLVTEAKQLSTNYISGLVSAPPMLSPDYVPYRLAISLLGGGLFRELRTRLNLSYNPGAEVNLLRVPYATFFVSTNDPKASVEAIIDQIRTLKSGTIRNENLNFLKGSYITNNYMKLESSGDIAAGLGEAEIMGDWRMAEALPEKIEKATPQDILDAARKYITGIKWAYMGDLSKAESTLPAFRELVY
jgi:predicted Zn-dependent peptidase